MLEKKTRRLAAILFADIAGYTALMQRDEQSALAHLRKFRQTLEAQVPAHCGQIIQFYGDGCVAAFQSSVEAATCARLMQESFLQAPSVPVRIGLHTGDVVFRDGNVYGDAVNVAARIESMGVPGSVLLSSSVRNHIKNKPEFVLQSLGQFAFKNVEKEMSVYALTQEGFAIPKRKEMRGKGRPVAKRRPLLWTVVAVAMMIMAGVVLWQQNKLRAAETGFLPKAIRQERVAVIPFRNNTGVENLDDFGYLTSDLITNGLTEADIRTCSPQTVLQYQHLFGVVPNNPEGKTSFSEVTGARYWIEGYFKSEGDSITIKSSLTDGWNGDVVRNFSDEKGHVDQKEQLANRLCRRIMGFWVAREDIEKGKFKSPLYEAYREYRKIFESDVGSRMGTMMGLEIKHGRRAFEIDSTFYTAALTDMFWQAERKNLRTDTLIALLEPQYDKMTFFEQTLFRANKSFYRRDYVTYGRLLEELYERFPRDPWINRHYSSTLSLRENRPAKAWEVANQIKLEQLNIPPSQKAARTNGRARNGLATGHFEAVIDLVDIYPRTKEWLGYYFFLKSKALIRSGQLDALENLSKEIEAAEISSHRSERQYDQAAFCNEVAEEFLLLNQPEQAQRWLNKALEWVKKEWDAPLNLQDSLHLARTNYLLGRYHEAVRWGEEAYESGRPGIGNKYRATLGAVYARLGQKDKAETIIQRLLERTNPFTLYYAAQICAELGDKKRAMDLLYERKEFYGIKGIGLIDYAQYDYLMRNLFEYPPFVELMWIRDEGLKD